MRPVRSALAAIPPAVLIASLLAAPAAVGGSPGANDPVCGLLGRSDVKAQLSAAGELALKVRCGLLPAAPWAAAARSQAPEDRPDQLINDRSTDTWPHITQSETTISVRGTTVLAGWNDSGQFLSRGDFTGYGRSTDMGATWTDLGPPTTPLGQVDAVFGDPVIMADLDRNPGEEGVFYFANLATSTNGSSIISVHKTTDGGLTWDSAADASPLAGDSFPDKEWLAVDTRQSGEGAGNVYVCYRRFGNGDGIRFSRSTDGAQTFTELPGTISQNPLFVQGCFVEVNPLNGHVYVVWRNTFTDPLTMRFRMSTDFGQTFGPEVTVGQAPPPENNTSACGRPAFVDDEPGATNRAIRSSAFPWMVVNPLDGTIGVVFHRGDLPGGSESDIAFTMSSDEGATWSPQVLVNGETTGQQFFPSIGVNTKGEMRVMYYSTQNSPTDRLIDVYAATTLSGGGGWMRPRRVTEVSFDRPQTNPNFDTFIVNCYMGDYNSILGPRPGLSVNRSFYLVWGDNRLDGNEQQNGLQPDPDIRFEREAQAH
jgi:hypothetical protein